MIEEPLYRKQREATENLFCDGLLGERILLFAFFLGVISVSLLIWLEK